MGQLLTGVSGPFCNSQQQKVMCNVDVETQMMYNPLHVVERGSHMASTWQPVGIRIDYPGIESSKDNTDFALR